MLTELKSTLEVISGYTDENRDGVSLEVFGLEEPGHSPVVNLKVIPKEGGFDPINVYVDYDDLAEALRVIDKVYGSKK